MKVTIKSVIRSSHSDFQCFEDQQIVFRVGNTLCIKQIGRPDCEFICLNKHLDKMLTFKPMTNRKGVFTAQKIGKDLELAMYNLGGQRKAVVLPLDASFSAQHLKVQLIVDEYDNYLLYGAVKTKESNCIFLIDFGKGKILAIGFLPAFEDIKVDVRENMTLSVCGNNGTYNYIKCLQYAVGKWEITEEILKRVPGQLVQHELLIGARKLIVSKNAMYVLEDNELSRSLDLNEEGSIVEVVKVPRGFVVRLSNDRLLLWADDSEEISFIKVGPLQLDLPQGNAIQGMKLSNNNEELWLRTTTKDVYVWRCDNVSPDVDPSELLFTKVEHAGSIEKEGTVSLSAQKKYALLAGCKQVVLWSIDRSQAILTTQFTDAIDPSKRAVMAGAINPDGSSIMLAFEDKIKLFKVLYTKFKFYAEFQVKRVQQIVYSHGGQLVACRYGRGQNSCILVYNLLRLTEVCSFKVGAQPNQIFWNELDDELYTTTDSNCVQIYKISQNIRQENIKFQDKIRYARLDYKGRKLLVSSGNKISVIISGKVIDCIDPPILDFQYIYPLYGMYFLVGQTGMLYWSKDLKFQTINEYALFDKKPFSLICRSGNLIAYSSYQQMLVLKIQRGSKSRQRIGEDIVMIQKDDIENLFDKVKEVQNKLDTLTSTTLVKSEEERQKYNSVIAKLKNKYEQEIRFADKNYQKMNQNKILQEKEHEDVFKTLEEGQVQGLNQLENMYERKCRIQKERIMQLQQDATAQKISYEELILKLEQKYHQDVVSIRESYAAQGEKESRQIEQLQTVHLKDKKRIEIQLVEVEEENQIAMQELQIAKDAMIKKLKEESIMANENYERTLVELDAKQGEVDSLNYKAQIHQSELRKMFIKLNQSENKVHMFQGELAKKKGMIEEKDQVVKEQHHQIADLEKAKYVLSFRTTQIRKQLEPKETMIDKLKSELLKLDEEYREIKKKNFLQDQKVSKLQTITMALKKQNSDLKIQLKYKERLHDELCSQIYLIINTIDPENWNNELIKLYKNYIKQTKFQNKNKGNINNDQTNEQINRHLQHVEESLLQVTNGNDKIMKGKDKQVIRKMNQNSKLIYQLNVMRKKENQYMNQKKDLVNQNARLVREVSQIGKNTTRSQTAKSKLTKRFVISRELKSRDKHATLDVSDFSGTKDTQDMRKDRNRLASARRTLMMQDEIKQKSGKFFNLAKELESTKRELDTSKKTILLQESQIEELNQHLFISVEPNS